MLKNIEVTIFLSNTIVGGQSYILFNAKKYYINKRTSYSLLKKIPKNKSLKIKVNAKIISNQYGYNINPFKPSQTMVLEKLL